MIFIGMDIVKAMIDVAVLPGSHWHLWLSASSLFTPSKTKSDGRKPHQNQCLCLSKLGIHSERYS